MKILVNSPIELPFTTGSRYTGLEKLAVQFAEQWAKLGHEVSIIAHKDTNIEQSVKLLPCEGYETIVRPDHAEIHSFQKYQSEFYNYDVIWDISHLHLPARYMPHLKTANVFSANPEYEKKAGSVKAPYNLISWSKWGVREIRKWYKQDSRYQETIMVDPEVFKPNPNIKRGERFITIGRMSPPKGNLNAVMLCKELGLPLDVCGGRGAEKSAGDELTKYEKHIQSLCDGKQIVFYGEVSDEQKIELLQSCKGLLYVTDHVEITSHKVQEAMMCFPYETIVQLQDNPLFYHKREYTGLLINIVTDYGITRVTPEHPFMTNKGWVKATNLTKEHQLCYNYKYEEAKTFYTGRISSFGKLITDNDYERNNYQDRETCGVYRLVEKENGVQKNDSRPIRVQDAFSHEGRTILLCGDYRWRGNYNPKETQQQTKGKHINIEYQPSTSKMVTDKIHDNGVLVKLVCEEKCLAMGDRGIFIPPTIQGNTSVFSDKETASGNNNRNDRDTNKPKQDGLTNESLSGIIARTTRFERIKEIYNSEVTNCPVYNFTTQSGTYIANGFIVHNCGAPVIIPNTGGMPEIVTHGVDGYLCNSLHGYVEAIRDIDKLTPMRDTAMQKYSPQIVAEGYITLFDKIIKGERW
jgi:glycosyltransferase involved in cell wall biosynthesis